MNPYLGIPNEYINKLLHKMIDHMLEIMVDPYFKPTNYSKIEGDNDYELIYCE